MTQPAMSAAPERRWPRAVLFGGSGFCGAHLAAHLCDAELVDDVLLVDLRPPVRGAYTARFDELLASGRIRFVYGDVRRPIAISGPADLIVNLAAVHREPGHKRHEYFETNLPGARHVCDFARVTGCRDVVFVSSIAVYAGDASTKSEDSTPSATSPYGESKREAEEIHRAWRAEDGSRRLVILRPGVVFGPGEGANVTRLVRGVIRGRFAYVGSPHVAKAGIYIGELVQATIWALDRVQAGGGNRGPQEMLANLTAYPNPTVREYVDAVAAVTGRPARVPTLPLPVVLAASALAYGVARLLGRRLDANPARLRKLARPNVIVPQALRDGGYQPRFTLIDAMREWRALRPDEWQ